jgi:uncharacterized protein YggE
MSDLTLERVRAAKQARDHAREDVEARARQFADAVRLAVDGGWSIRALAGAIGMSPARVHQVYHS